MAEKKIKFEAMLKELDEIAKQLENGDTELDEALGLFKRGVELTKECNKILDNAEQQIKIIESSEE